MTYINRIEFSNIRDNDNENNLTIPQQNIDIFPASQQKTDKEIFEDSAPPEVDKALKLRYLYKNPELFNDEALMMELEEIKATKLDVEMILDNFRLNSDGEGGLIELMTRMTDKLKPSTIESYRKYFTEELEKKYNFNKKYKNIGDQTNFKYKNYEYKSDKYNVIQKDENILEIENTVTKEKRIIDFRELLSDELNGIQDIIPLKNSIQKLPGDFLFNLAEEVSLIESRNAVQQLTFEIDEETGELVSPVDNEDGQWGYLKNGMEKIITDTDEETIIHEVAHAIFHNKKGQETLKNNRNLVRIFKKGAKLYRKETEYSAKKDGYTNTGYWSKNLSEFGAEIIRALYTNDTETLETIDKYAPGAIPMVIEIYQQRLNATDKHKKITANDYTSFLKKLSNG